MEMETRTDRRHLLTQGSVAALAGLALSGALVRLAGAQEATLDAAAATPITAADSATAEANLALFDRLDFEAWNNRDWDLFRQIHGDDVHVGGLRPGRPKALRNPSCLCAGFHRAVPGCQDCRPPDPHRRRRLDRGDGVSQRWLDHGHRLPAGRTARSPRSTSFR